METPQELMAELDAIKQREAEIKIELTKHFLVPKPISTVPRNINVLVFDKSTNKNGDWGIAYIDEDTEILPQCSYTHWLPLPPFPKKN